MKHFALLVALALVVWFGLAQFIAALVIPALLLLVGGYFALKAACVI